MRSEHFVQRFLSSMWILFMALMYAFVPVSSYCAVTITEYTVPTASSVPSDITAGPDGNLWFTERDGNKIGRITTAGVITEYTIPTASSVPSGISAGPDGNLWFTEETGNKIGRITTAGVITEFAVPTASSVPVDITAGPDGNLWFTEYAGNKIGRITTAGVITEFTNPMISGGAPLGIAAGLDGSLWFTLASGYKIGRITTAGSFWVTAIPTTASEPFGITAGPDGNLWFTEYAGNKIGRITTSGVITEFTIPTASSGPLSITAGPDGNVWFTENGGNKIGRITTSGVIKEYALPTAGSWPYGITAGPDGDIWFTNAGENKIGHFRPDATFTVNNTNDSGPGSLRQTIANAAAGNIIDVSATGTITLSSGELFIDKSLTINGPGPSNLTISGGGASRVIYVDGESWGTVNISGLTISDGLASGAYPSNIGGGILLQHVTLNLSNSVVTENEATSVGGGILVAGGTLNLSDSTISNNIATEGGGLRVMSGIAVNVTGSTINGNEASNAGAGILTQGPLNLANSTISGNSAAWAAGLFLLGDTTTLKNVTIASNIVSINGRSANLQVQGEDAIVNASDTIIAGPSPSALNCSIVGGGALISGGHNLDSTNECGFTATGDLVNTDPLLGPLADHGGPTLTMALLAGSPALDAGDPNNVLPNDQRGMTRPQGTGSDIGAYEHGPGDPTSFINATVKYDTGGGITCAVNPVPYGGDSICTMTPINLFPNYYHISDVRVHSSGSAFWVVVDPTSKYTFKDVTGDKDIEVTFVTSNIWLYKNNLLQENDGTISGALFDAAILNTDTIKVQYGAYVESGGITCNDIGNVVPRLSGGWSSGTVRTIASMSTVRGPFTITGTCALIIDGMTIE